MPIIRAVKSKNKMAVPRKVIDDSSLSMKAKGVFGFLMTLPPDLPFHISDISRSTTTSYRACSKALDELIAKKYIYKIVNKKECFSKQVQFKINPQVDMREVTKSLGKKRG